MRALSTMVDDKNRRTNFGKRSRCNRYRIAYWKSETHPPQPG
jgi:hypothetical protein